MLDQFYHINSLPNDLSNWLKNKNNKSVIYISMGSLLSPSDELIQEILNGISDTDYSVVWSIRNKNIPNIDSSKIIPLHGYHRPLCYSTNQYQ